MQVTNDCCILYSNEMQFSNQIWECQKSATSEKKKIRFQCHLNRVLDAVFHCWAGPRAWGLETCEHKLQIGPCSNTVNYFADERLCMHIHISSATVFFCFLKSEARISYGSGRLCIICSCSCISVATLEQS